MASSPTALLYPYTPPDGTEEEEESGNDIIFCSRDNSNEAAIYINQELEIMGVGSILTDSEPDIVKILNTSYELIQQYKSALRRIDHINTSLQRARSDLTLQTEATARHKNEAESLGRKLAQQEEKQRQLLIRNKSLSGQLKVEQEECQKLRYRMNHKEQQYLHDMKRKDKEFHRLNERLGQFVLDKSHERKLSIKMLNNLQKQHTGHKQSVISKEESMYKLVIAHYEERQKELMLENTSLRDSLCNMEREIVAMLNQNPSVGHLDEHNKENTNPNDLSVNSSSLLNITDTKQNKSQYVLANGHYQMPYDIVRQDIEANLREKYQKLREHIKSLREYNSEPLDLQLKREKYENEIEELGRKLSDYRDIISQQEAMLEQQLVECKAEATFIHFNESHYLKRVELLELREEKTTHREEHIKQEEKRLNRLARQLDRERHDFEDKKSQFLRQQLDSSIFATPTKSVSHMESFFTGLSSTPFVFSSSKPTTASVLHKQFSLAAASDTATSSKTTVSTAENEIDMRNDMSLSFEEEQTDILND